MCDKSGVNIFQALEFPGNLIIKFGKRSLQFVF